MLIPKEKQFDIWSQNLTIPIPAIDIVIFTVYQNELCVVLLKQDFEWESSYILPGWIIAKWFSLEENFDDILQRKTWITGVYKEQLYTFWRPWRDKRWHTLSIAYFALVSMENFFKNIDFTKVAIVKYKDINEKNIWFKDKNIGWDHFEIIQYAKQRLQWKLEYTNVAKEILPEKFKMSQLQAIYEIITGKIYDKRNFQKKVFSLKILSETWDFDTSTNRPAKLYTFYDKELKIIENNSFV